ncbi:hypothetical protein [Ligilactobacillus aviarius]|uniref:hypothetical protein n=1 Tax=Ligilactobacillus aviarius TaxID=1606 RepID=UPI00242D3081|nr:hypothetical protein [Ligilactobacillus aviarius]
MLLLATKVWEQRKLGDISEKRIEKNNSLSIDNILSNSAIYGIVKQNQYFDKTIANNIQNYYIVHTNDFIYNPRISNNAPFGPISRNKLAESGVMSPLYLVFYFSKKSLSDFFEIYFKSSKWHNFMYMHGNSGARSDRFAIKDNEFFKMRVKIPHNKSEIDKIYRLNILLNSLITLYERKTRLLSKLRTFLTQRLFSNSSKVSLYFDNKNWSKHKISEFLTERNEKVIPNPSIPLVSFTVEKGVTPKSKRYNREFLVKDDKKKYKITKKNDIVYNPANLKFGAIARNKFGNAAFSPIYVTFITKLNPVFTEFLVRRKDFIKLALKYQEGTVYERMAVKSKDFLSLKIYLPNSSRDINHIAQILQSLDTLVSLNKNKISLITLIKKELLNTMFI